MAMETGPIEDVCPVEHGDLPAIAMLVYQRVYVYTFNPARKKEQKRTILFSAIVNNYTFLLIVCSSCIFVYISKKKMEVPHS